MSKALITLGIQGPDGQRRVTISETTLVGELYMAVQEAYGLSSNTNFFLTQDMHKKIVIENGELWTVSEYKLKHRDRLFMHYSTAYSQQPRNGTSENTISQVIASQKSTSQEKTSQSNSLQGNSRQNSAPMESTSQSKDSTNKSSASQNSQDRSNIQSSSGCDNTSSSCHNTPSVAVLDHRTDAGLHEKVVWIAVL